MLLYLNGDENAGKYCDKNYDKYQKYSHNIINMTCCNLKYTSLNLIEGFNYQTIKKHTIQLGIKKFKMLFSYFLKEEVKKEKSLGEFILDK